MSSLITVIIVVDCFSILGVRLSNINVLLEIFVETDHL